MKRHVALLSAATILLAFYGSASLGWAQAEPSNAEIDCSPYRHGELATLIISVRGKPGTQERTLTSQRLIVQPEYIDRPVRRSDVRTDAARFAIEIARGLPPSESNPEHLDEQAQFTLLVEGDGRAYGKPTLNLWSLTAAPIAESLTSPNYKEVGDGPAGLTEIHVEGQSDYVTDVSQLFAEIGENGELAALLQCERSSLRSNPTCYLIDQIGMFEAQATFPRSELPSLNLIRDRMVAFTACLTRD